MRVKFADRNLERCAQSETQATLEFGPIVGKAFARRLLILTDTTTFNQLFAHPALRLHPLKGELKGKYALTLHNRWRLIVIPLSSEEILISEVSNHYD